MTSEATLREALQDCKEALDSVWAAIGDALLSGKGISKSYSNAIANEARAASDKARAALATPSATPVVQPEAQVMERAQHRDRDLYASYANHCAIQKKVPLTWHSWKREKGQPCHDVRGERDGNKELPNEPTKEKR